MKNTIQRYSSATVMTANSTVKQFSLLLSDYDLMALMHRLIGS
jgi:hypothetical protein